MEWEGVIKVAAAHPYQ